MQDLAQWLAELGMSEYAQHFAENDIDIDLLGELADQDFDRLGVSLGHRRRTSWSGAGWAKAVHWSGATVSIS